MKRLIYFTLFIVFSISDSLGQHVTYSFSGAISGAITWNSYDTIYITGDVTIDAGASLTISPSTAGNDIGTYIVVVGPYGFTISETGSLIINGSSVENVIFTADSPEENYPKGDKNFGETGETWRNIFFSNSSGSSLIDYSIIEYGQSPNHGGGIRIQGNNIRIANTKIRNCNAPNNGGGIFARAYPGGSTNVQIENCEIYNNIAENGGGVYHYANTSITSCKIHGNSSTFGAGIYFYGAGSISNTSIYDNSGEGIYNFPSGTIITNCLIYGNDTGVFLEGSSNIINCSITNNTTGINSASSGIVLNTILWQNSTEYFINDGTSLELAYCAVEGGISGGIDGGHNVNLSSSNTADTGPNFVNAVSDYHINSWITPIVDGGISNYSTISAPALDSEGKVRINAIDIGAYEFVYYVWEGDVSTTWGTPGNWLGNPASVPTSISGNKVIIPFGTPNYPQTSSLSLSNRSYLSIDPGAGLRVTGATSVGSGCTFLLKSDDSGSANFISGTSVSGSFTIQLFLDGGGGPDYKWHYVNPPVNAVSKAVLTSAIGNTYNLLRYDETKVETLKSEGWQWHNGDDGTTPFSLLYRNQGYNVYVNSDATAVFSGTVQSGSSYTNYNISLSNFNSQNGWNLIGNPYTCSIDLNQITIGADVESVVYSTSENDYMAYNITTGVGTNGGTNLIPAMEGFFVHVTDDFDPYVTINSSSRVYSRTSLHKGKGGDTYTFPILKFNVSNAAANTDESIIYFFDDAKSGFDKRYDGYKMFSQNSLKPQICSSIDGIDFSINGLPMPDIRTTIPLKVRLGETQNYSFNVLNLENLNGMNVSLIHGENKIDLKNNPNYSFSGTPGTISDMSILFENVATKAPELKLPDAKKILCWYKDSKLMIKSQSPDFENNSSLIIYDINGNTIFADSKISIGYGETIEIPVSLNNGMYISTLSNQNFRISKKLVVTR